MPVVVPRPAPRGRRRWVWPLVVLTVVVLALCAGLVVQRAERTTPEGGRGAGGPSVGATPQPGLALPGAGGAVVQLQAARSIIRVDLTTGDVTVTPTPDLDPDSDLLAGPGWVISKSVGQPSGVLVRDGDPAQLLPPTLQQAGQVFPAGDDQVWVVPDQPTAGFRTALLVDLSGARVGTTRIRLPEKFGTPVGHLSDALVLESGGATYDAAPAGLNQRSRGTLLGIGTDTTLTWVCNQAKKCDARFNNADKTLQYLPAVRVSLTGLYPCGVQKALGSRGIVSPDRRWVALELPGYTHTGARLVVVDLRSGHRIEVRGRLAGSKPDDQAAWTPNSRYLLALTDGRLRVLDLGTEQVTTPDGAPGDLQHLTVPGAPAM